jgi:hypothetical protein
MTLDEIKEAVDAGCDVYWCTARYGVVKDKLGQYLIECYDNGSCIGLTWSDGVTLNGREQDFYSCN